MILLTAGMSSVPTCAIVSLRKVWLHFFCTLSWGMWIEDTTLPCLLRAEQIQFPQPPLTHPVLQSLSHLAALHWTCSHLPTSLLRQGTQNWAEYSMIVLQMSKKGKTPLLSTWFPYSCSLTCYKTKPNSTSSVESHFLNLHISMNHHYAKHCNARR